MYSKLSIDKLVEEAAKIPTDQNFPDPIERLLTLSPEIVLDLLPYFLDVPDNSHKQTVVLKLILRSLDQLRYNLDRKIQKAIALLNQVQEILSDIYQQHKSTKLTQLNAVLYESLLPLTLNFDGKPLKNTAEDAPDIIPKLPELLEQIRRENRIRSSFDLFEGLMSQMQIMPVPVQLELINELTVTTKSMPHEIAVMMLLHPNVEIRKSVVKLFTNYVPIKVFTPLDLRRLIVIRGWLPTNERPLVDDLIKKIRLQNIPSAPYPSSKLNAVMASTFDGAGAQLILFQTKQDNQRIIGGFIVKQGVGIREPWVKIKAAKGEFEEMCERSTMQLKPVTLAYVDKAVRHFLAEGRQASNVPSPILLQISELTGATEWRAEPISIREELNRLSQKIDFGLKDHHEIAASFSRSGQWIQTESFFRHWFECGELAEKTLQKVTMTYQKAPEKISKVSMETIAIEEIIKPQLQKWKTLILFMCLWARSKTIKEPLWKDLMILLDQLEAGSIPLANIPMIQNIARQTIMTIMANAIF